MEWVRPYGVKYLVRIDKRASATIYNKADEYIPILIEDAWTRTRFKNWKQDRPYRVQHIRIKDVQKYVKEKTWKELIFKWEEPKAWQWKKRFRKGI